MESTYECDCCGACCRDRGFVECDGQDTVREPKLLTAQAGKPLSQSELNAHPDKVIILLLNPCSFLGGDNRCEIYSTRPHDCRTYEPGHDDCQHARLGEGLPRLEPVRRVQVEEVASAG